MKYARRVVVFLTLTPWLVYAQNQQFFDCRTLAMAGNFVGADETLVDGLVCKVGRPKTSAAAGKAAEGSQALLGIIEPEVLRSKEKAGANPGGREATEGAAPGSAASDFAPGGQAPSSRFVTNPGQSLGEIARAFRQDRGVAITSKPEQGELEGNQAVPRDLDGQAMVVTRLDRKDANQPSAPSKPGVQCSGQPCGRRRSLPRRTGVQLQQKRFPGEHG